MFVLLMWCYKCTLVFSMKLLHSVNPLPSILFLYLRILFEWMCRVCIAYIYVIYFSHYLHSISLFYLSLFPFSISLLSFPSLSLLSFPSIFPSLSLALSIFLPQRWYFCYFAIWDLNFKFNFENLERASVSLNVEC